MILLDHLTRGRAMMGVGPGALPTDAAMIGIDPLDQRAALEEDFEVLMRLLLNDEPISIETKISTPVKERSSRVGFPASDVGSPHSTRWSTRQRSVRGYAASRGASATSLGRRSTGCSAIVLCTNRQRASW